MLSQKGTVRCDQLNVAERPERTDFGPVLQVPYFDDICVNDVYAILEGLISEVETRPQAPPIS
jgi:hypothetical protein